MGDKSIVKKFDAQPSISTIRSTLLNFIDCFIIIAFSIEAISTIVSHLCLSPTVGSLGPRSATFMSGNYT